VVITVPGCLEVVIFGLDVAKIDAKPGKPAAKMPPAKIGVADSTGRVDGKVARALNLAAERLLNGYDVAQ